MHSGLKLESNDTTEEKKNLLFAQAAESGLAMHNKKTHKEKSKNHGAFSELKKISQA